jgi:hypothetical protein
MTRRRPPKAVRDRRKARSAEPLPVAFNVHDEKVARLRLEQAKVDHLAVYGPGLTFGELAIGEWFMWVGFMSGGGPMWKVTEVRYEFWIHGVVGGRLAYGTAEDYYRVERWTTPSRTS